MREIDTAIVHCSASPQGRGDDAATIHDWHCERGFSGIGYHMVILENGVMQSGRPEYWIGAHARGHNAHSLGVCLIGEGGDATDEQMHSLSQLLMGWNHKYNGINVIGHNDVNSHKTCPGFDVKSWWATRG